MSGFETKKALLTYLGKNPDDRKLVDRLIAKGEVWVEDGMYYVNEDRAEEKVEKKSESNEEKIDDGELKKLKAMNDKLMAAYKKLSKEKEVYMGMYDHLVFFYNKFEEYRKFVDRKVYGQAEYNRSEKGTQDTKETVRDSVYERYNFTYGEVEEAECEAVRKIIDQRASELAELPF